MYKIIGAITSGIVLGFFLGLFFSSHFDGMPKKQLAEEENVPRYDVIMDTPIKAMDKKVLRERKAISKSIEKDNSKEVTAAATLIDDSGKTRITAIMDTKTGAGSLLAIRSRAEWMKRNELGVGASVGSLGTGWTGEYRRVFARVWNVYPDIRLNGWQWQYGQRLDTGHRYDGQASLFLTIRW